MFKERALGSLSIETRNRLNLNGALEREEIFGKGIAIEVTRQVTDQEVFVSLVKMAEKMRDKIFEYDTLVSDEAGGRLITLFLRNFINIKREEQGMPYLKNTFFLRNKNAEAVNNFIGERKSDLGKVLLVTELIRNGTGMMIFGNMFRNHEVSFDVASVSSMVLGVPEKLENEYKCKVFVGEDQILGAGEAFHSRDFAGVSYGYGGYDNGWKSPYPKRNFKVDPGEIYITRETVMIWAQEAARII